MKFSTLAFRFIGFLNEIIVLIIALGVVVFLYGLISYIANASSEDKRKESIRYMTAGIIGLFIMFAFWGITYIFSTTFFGEGVGIPQIN